ncbi:CusA/CzcA family heavy metal efflux RND transporter [Sinomicrobium weinanense]|uniref:CusA/CzcA family heavy metal efflux RND transporter n=1 Tax=Sinomicrobium weinanense TaxID=2842200 RepID=A0A926Q2Y0_9FLAO|nr:CusA/CzcA family heavy metal efflux RND transporter [Sinomicrobium weinanense]MBC9797092.1 CusA/CzcA family heavy metal efflux RND transporter [Sinomicrobium weinanense]MBU3122679.1 CusA/CzcA family heavy metal efflux RND transporter [Sinomicrobium weinanense]
MLDRIIQFSVKNKLAVGIFILLWTVYGVYEVTRLPIDAVPDITNNQVQIITTAPSLGGEDVERLITFPIEQAMSNIPRLKESRSISRFGLSVVTTVFDDDVDVYWARQQVAERLQNVEIDENANTPEMTPVTTGLGEIYQYVLKPQPGYEHKFSLTELRTIQDWTVKRQLLGTPGVADVSTFGGKLKQYEVAVNPARLKAHNLTISDVFTALNRSNENTGGAYIEKGPAVLYIRSIGLAKSIEDIQHIVIKTTQSGSPVLVKNVADVNISSAIRYGALTTDDIGEAVGGIVMMLKGENANTVVDNVKERVAEIEKILPEGLKIVPFLDRTKMVDNAIGTVEKNLIEGALIVVFVLVLFLGNLRAGFIVASVIPLSMLFAVIMMNAFGVSGNLMSLGALDFGLIVDGAVIIVEAILHHLHASQKYKGIGRISQQQMDEDVSGSASRMMNAAVFGQIIILIVYLPILSLQGIEGKMFKPMAQTVAFAILGAFILSLTYVPMISSLFISKRVSHKPNFSDRVMSKLERFYERWLRRALKVRKGIVATALVLFAIALFVFSRMGGEFIPQLEEGDFAVETRLLLGTNLTTTTETIQKISAGLKEKYPEVEQVVSRIGSAEIPTDPMPIEGGDMIVVLKDKSEWVSASSFEEMAEKMGQTAQEIAPGVNTSFQYPVQMRFNELMTGAKQDVVCKIYGEDLDKLARYATQLGTISRAVDGTADVYVEKVTGMPQIVIDYHWAEMAKYGLYVQDINRTVNAAFAGAVAGNIYEGEKRFDLVVRMENKERRDINNVRNLLIATPSGMQIPLYQVASVEAVEGPNQIQRENAKRRIIVGFNVRGRDVESIVEELEQKVNEQMNFDPGYYVTYGGAFENLKEAKNRLGVAVPVALLLIFALLYFAFRSIKEGVLIFTAIPLSAIGGVFALALRDMPFSISAGVGFIALFGVAVLNGIVLISEFNRIQKQGEVTDPLQIVLSGTKKRLRPVLMTAAVASLGFLPMALSNGAGAEVQRPLATVVIGGLITATFLTLFVLPAIYLMSYYTKTSISMKKRKNGGLTVLLIGLFMSSNLWAQEPVEVSLSESIEIAMKNNKRVKAAQYNERSRELLSRSGYDIPKTLIDIDYGQFNSKLNDTRFGISQTFNFPTVYTRRKKALTEDYMVAKIQTEHTGYETKARVRTLFYELVWLQRKKELLQYADSIYRLMEEKSDLRFSIGETNILEKSASQSARQFYTNQLNMVSRDIEMTRNTFNAVLQDSVMYVPVADHIKIDFSPLAEQRNTEDLPRVKLSRHKAEAARWRWKTERARMLPDITIGYNNLSITGWQTNASGQEVYYDTGHRFNYINAGLSIPLFFGSRSAQSRSAKVEWQRQFAQADAVKAELSARVANAEKELLKYRESLEYYESEGLANAQAIIDAANSQLENGDIDYLRWVMVVNQAITIKNEYLDTVNNYNKAVISVQTLNHL